MIVLPSLVFYVQAAGGTKEQYGLVCSSFALASFVFKPILGYWSDITGNKFRVPYLASIGAAMLGALLYFLASLFSGLTSVTLILVGRLLGGCGAANNSLGYTYIAQVINHEVMTQASAILSMIRVIGMSVAPAFNAVLKNVHFEFQFFGNEVEVNPLNSVGLVIFVGNALGFIVIYMFLKEPLDRCTHGVMLRRVSLLSWQFWRSFSQPDIFVPLMAYFTLNFTFQFMETSLAPAAHDALGWETVAISFIFGIDAIFSFLVYVITFQLSCKGVKDTDLMKAGLWFSTIGYTCMYLWWRQGISVAKFVVPSK
jgi:MFS family permease